MNENAIFTLINLISRLSSCWKFYICVLLLSEEYFSFLMVSRVKQEIGLYESCSQSVTKIVVCLTWNLFMDYKFKLW